MTAVDFRDGGYDDGYAPHGSRRADAHSHHWDAHNDAPGWDDPARYSTDAEGDIRAARDGVAARVARLLNYLGALVSVALMVGLLVWGYRLVTRDVSGVPVIRALAGEARVAPDEPGGRQAEGRGLAVNTVAAGDTPAGAGQVEIAPAAAGLAAEDVAMGEFGATVREPGQLAEVAPSPESNPVLATSDAEVRAAEVQRLADEKAAAERVQAEADAAAARAAAGAQVVADVAALPETSPEPATDAPVDSAITDLTGAPAQTVDPIGTALAEAGAEPPVAASRPAPRPRRLAAAAAAAPASTETAAAETAPEAAPDAAPAPAPVRTAEVAAPEAAPEAEAPKAASGTNVVQIGAFDSDKLARGEWSRVSGKNGGLFSGKSQVVQETKRNGRTFWRLRVAGFGSRDEARAFCAELKASGTDCIPTQAN